MGKARRLLKPPYIFFKPALQPAHALQYSLQQFRERLSEKNVHATIPKGNIGCDQYTFPNDCSCRTYFGCFPLALANICPCPPPPPPPVPFFQISSKKSALKTTHNSWVARDVTKNQTKKLSILLSFYFHEVLQYLNTFT